MSTVAVKDAEIKTFTDLSEVLTGHEKLAEKRDGKKSLAESYYELIETAFQGGKLKKLLSTFKSLKGDGDFLNKEVDIKIMRDKDLGVIAREIIMLWYMSTFKAPGKRDGAPETPEQYYQGLFWPTIRAHPLGLSGGYFGYWRYRPEN